MLAGSEPLAGTPPGQEQDPSPPGQEQDISLPGEEQDLSPLG